MGNNVLAFPGTSPRWWNFFVKGWKFLATKWNKALFVKREDPKVLLDLAKSLCECANKGDIPSITRIETAIRNSEKGYQDAFSYFFEKDPVKGSYSVTREGVFEATRPPRI